MIFDPQPGGRVVGRLVAEGFSDELGDRRYAIVDGIDGRTHYVELGVRHVDDEPLVRNTIVELRARDVGPRPVDRTIADIASRHHGVYSIDRHRDADPRMSVEFVQTHVRRLRRCGGRAWPTGYRTVAGRLGPIISIARCVSRKQSGRCGPRG